MALGRKLGEYYFANVILGNQHLVFGNFLQRRGVLNGLSCLLQPTWLYGIFPALQPF
jgi:hypothetical protein